MRDIYSWILYAIEILSPRALVLIDLDSLVDLSKFCFFVLLAAASYESLTKYAAFSHLPSVIISICFSLIAVVKMPSNFVIWLSMLYFVLARAMDGVVCGFGIARLVAFFRRKFWSIISTFTERETTQQVFTVIYLFLTTLGIYTLYRRLPLFSRNKVLTGAVVAVCISGMLFVPLLKSRWLTVAYFSIFPLSIILGLVVAMTIRKK